MAARFVTATADSAIVAKPCFFAGITVTPDGTNNVTVSIYDNASAGSGSKPLPTMTFAGNGGTQYLGPPHVVKMTNGIYVDVTVAGGGTVEYTVHYQR